MADLRVGSTDIADVKVGSTQINKVYQGTNLVWQKSVVAGSSWTYTASSTQTGVSSATYTSGSISIGDAPGAGETRVIYAAVGIDHSSTSGTPSFSSVTIAGQTATQLGLAISGDKRWTAAIFRAEVATGTTGTLSLTSSKAISDGAVSFYRAINFDTTTETVLTYNDNTWPNSNLTVPISTSAADSAGMYSFFGNQNAAYPNYQVSSVNVFDLQNIMASDALEHGHVTGQAAGTLTFSSTRSKTANANAAGVYLTVAPL